MISQSVCIYGDAANRSGVRKNAAIIGKTAAHAIIASAACSRRVGLKAANTKPPSAER